MTDPIRKAWEDFDKKENGLPRHWHNHSDLIPEAKPVSLIGIAVFLIIFVGIVLLVCIPKAHAQVIPAPTILTASYYSIQSLKTEGTFKYSKGVMANGKLFRDENYTCATRDFKLGETLKITSLSSGKSVICKVTDRISKRFKGKRIDLSISAMRQIDGIKSGLVKVIVERIG